MFDSLKRIDSRKNRNKRIDFVRIDQNLINIKNQFKTEFSD